MAMPSSGTITFAQLQTEFGGSNPISLSEYYRGGGLVPNITANNAVPTSGAIDLQDFYGAINRSFSLAIGDIIAAGSFVTAAELGIYRNGQANSTTWTTPTETTIGDGYEVRVTVDAELGVSGPARGTWHALTSNRFWYVTNDVSGTTIYTQFTIDIRIAGGGATVCSETLTMSAEVY